MPIGTPWGLKYLGSWIDLRYSGDLFLHYTMAMAIAFILGVNQELSARHIAK
ncbi:hypothetical protein BO70DRAFT_179834 [Aspergillus heteromorphus CBS 117.55]|uniref:Uncharacterized protein n=1 Tax=Aspergillus heteromorphus CBS 117.55 TaxID=1448321 RepID=A0A317WTU4_9EURO|nr:uncharacterized protein BO70DRAFT_179834 [Aspergillus heteromorphus CBS 117.55]PWY88358.1 hypothetical protein BO70DRAFT_179834 [Aspergillus heteromorphus CBS 117.55]